jgi:hypothetical protein
MRKDLLVQNEGFTLRASARTLLRLLLELSAHRRRCAIELKVLRECRSIGTAAPEAAAIWKGLRRGRSHDLQSCSSCRRVDSHSSQDLNQQLQFAQRDRNGSAGGAHGGRHTADDSHQQREDDPDG